MKKNYPVLIYLLLSLAFAVLFVGCDGGKLTGNGKADYGSLSLTLAWPDTGQASQETKLNNATGLSARKTGKSDTTPSAATGNIITVEILDPDTGEPVMPMVTAGPDQTTVVISNVPVGKKWVRVRQIDANHTILFEGNSIIDVTAGVNAPVSIPLLPVGAPNITLIRPIAGPVGTPVTVTGLNFGIAQGSSSIAFNERTAAVTSWNETEIRCSVPAGAVTGPVVVTVNGIASNGVTFTVQTSTADPVIETLHPTSTIPGGEVYISGSNFGDTQGTGTVTLSGMELSVESWSSTSIKCPVPLNGTTGPIQVSVNGNPSNSVTLTVDQWTSSASLPVGRMASVTAAPGNGYIYAINGYIDYRSWDLGYSDGRMFYAPLQADGTLGSWSESTTWPPDPNFSRAAAGVATYNGRIYLGGGAYNDGPNYDGNIWYCQPTASGDIVSWTLDENPAPNPIGSWPYFAAHNGYLYAGGGYRAFVGTSNWLAYTPINSNGTLDSWTITTNLPANSAKGRLEFYGNYAYLLLGDTEKMYYASVNSDGSIGNWIPTTSLPGATSLPGMFIKDGRVYVVQGGTTNMYYSHILPDGSLGPWKQCALLPAAFYPFAQGTLIDGFYYILGDAHDFSGVSPPEIRRVHYLKIP